jgi:hypothetical protein
MEIVKNYLPVLFGVLSDMSEENSLVGFIIDSLDGSAIIRANCDSPEQAKCILGFDELGIDYYSPEDDEQAFAAEIKNALITAFPEGYSLEWIGSWRNDPRTVKLCGWLDGTKPQQDDLFDYEVPDRILVQNTENAKKSGYVPNPQFWAGDKSKAFYVGYVGAVRVVSALIQNCKTQKELLERVNRLHLDAMIMASKSNSGIILP